MLGGCLTSLPYGSDSREVAARYPHRYTGECSSWLRSYKQGTHVHLPRLAALLTLRLPRRLVRQRRLASTPKMR